MALPERHYRGDIIVMVDWTATGGVGAAWTNFCGATSVSLTVDNAVQEEVVADCDDWTLPPQNVAEYGAQSWSITINGTLAKQNRDKILRAAADQVLLPIRVHIVGATAGEVEYIDGSLILPSLTIDNIANVDRAAVSLTLNGRFKEAPELTDAA